ncbi:sensor histidine kinase [Halosimplex sp. TS25]|uniref:sensor histidine kinase n=1 Tax=Halosimplex rarum TaxID=3396619 RepID=UPI0039EC6C66
MIPLFEHLPGFASRSSGRTESGRSDGGGSDGERRVRTDGGFDRVLADPDLVVAGIDALDDVFYVYDEDARLVAWNRRLNDVLGLDDDELRGTRAEDFFIEADRERVREAVADVFERGETTVEARVKTGGPVVRFQLSGHRLVDDDGTVVGFSGIGRDVTEKHEQAVRLSLQNERLESFAGTVSHDLRNPLQVATGLIELERGERESARLDRVGRALDRMERIVADVLTVAREGSAVKDPTGVALATAARRAWDTVETDDATLDVRTQTVVEGDPDRLDRLFANLFRNAVEHGGPGVAISVVDTDRGFAVEDDGPGIPEADRERVFDSGVSGTRDGTGFGLDIVRGIAEAHGWTVAVTDRGNVDGSNDSDGARFEFDLGLVGGAD